MLFGIIREKYNINKKGYLERLRGCNIKALGVGGVGGRNMGILAKYLKR